MYPQHKLAAVIKIKDAFEPLSEQEFNKILDAPVWTALLAAYTTDGHVTDSEREDAFKLAKLRTFTAPKSIRELYKKISERFPRRFKVLDERLPANTEDKVLYIRAQVREAHKLIFKLDEDVAALLQESFSSFYTHVFNADKSFFHYFAVPVVSGYLEKKYGGKKSPAGT